MKVRQWQLITLILKYFTFSVVIPYYITLIYSSNSVIVFIISSALFSGIIKFVKNAYNEFSPWLCRNHRENCLVKKIILIEIFFDDINSKKILHSSKDKCLQLIWGIIYCLTSLTVLFIYIKTFLLTEIKELF